VAHPTMEDVAQRAGVSRALVSLVLNDSPKVSERRRQAVLTACAELGYRRNAAARQLASRRNGTIGVMLNDMHNPFFAEIYDGIETMADAAGRQLLFTNGSRRPERERRAIDSMIEHRVEGMILVSPRLPVAVVAAASRIAPVVVVGRVVRGPHIDSVANDEHVGARAVVAHLIELGHRAIVHVHGGAGAGAHDRCRGYEQAMTAYGLTPDVVPGDFTEAAGAAAALVLLARRVRPTAVFAANDLVAAGVLDAFEAAGLRVPDDVSIVGYDNNFLARMQHVALTTIDQSTNEMGRIAFELLARRIDAPDMPPSAHLVTPTLVARRTSGPVAS
jgi:DNA-binding LacI/PurR family transcriptional regulator